MKVARELLDRLYTDFYSRQRTRISSVALGGFLSTMSLSLSPKPYGKLTRTRDETLRDHAIVAGGDLHYVILLQNGTSLVIGGNLAHGSGECCGNLAPRQNLPSLGQEMNPMLTIEYGNKDVWADTFLCGPEIYGFQWENLFCKTHVSPTEITVYASYEDFELFVIDYDLAHDSFQLRGDPTLIEFVQYALNAGTFPNSPSIYRKTWIHLWQFCPTLLQSFNLNCIFMNF